jgi:hypothetical protein
VRNPLATIASPAHSVSKPGSEKYRLTVDCRAVNACCIPFASSVPNIETMVAALSEGDSSCRVMAKLDFPQALGHIPLAGKSQELFSVQTPLGTYTPTRMLQGSQDASNYFHGVVSPLFDELHMGSSLSSTIIFYTAARRRSCCGRCDRFSAYAGGTG